MYILRTQTHAHTHTHISIYAYMYVCTYILCVRASCVCVQATEGATERDELRDLLGLETPDQSRDSQDSREGGEPPIGTTHPMRDIHV